MKVVRPLLTLLVAAVALSACGPAQTSGDDDDDTTVDGGVTGEGGMQDSGLAIDRILNTPVIIYAHTATELFTVNQTTFDLTRVGSFALTDDITDLAVTPDGNIYGCSRTDLYRIDRTTGAGTLVSTLTGDVGSSNVGMTFLPDGTLLAADKAGQVRKINPTTGQVTRVGQYGNGLNTAGDLVAVADGTMYAISDQAPGGGSAATNNYLLTVNTTNGAGTVIGTGIGHGRVFGAAYWNGKVYAFSEDGKIIEINRQTGVGTLVKTHASTLFWGAGVTSLVPIL